MSYYYKYLFENNLYEGLVKSSDVVGQLINKLDFNLKEQEYKSEYDPLKNRKTPLHKKCVGDFYIPCIARRAILRF